jgi:hypothetical protein
MQTVVQELIDELNELSNHYYTLSEYDTCHGIGIAVEFIMTKLEIEKQQIMMAFNDGKINSVLKKRDSEEYYNQTYKNQ